METFSIALFHKENLSSINLFQTRGSSALANSLFFKVHYKNNAESDELLSSHSNGMSLYKVFLIQTGKSFLHVWATLVPIDRLSG